MILWFTIGWPHIDCDSDPLIFPCQSKHEAIMKAENMSKIHQEYDWTVSKTVYVPLRIKVDV